MRHVILSVCIAAGLMLAGIGLVGQTPPVLPASGLGANTFTGIQLLPDGSSGAPSLGFSAQATAGLYRQGSGITGVAGRIATSSDGTAASPGYSFANEAGTGMYRSAAGVLGLAATGAAVGTISATTTALTGTTLTLGGLGLNPYRNTASMSRAATTTLATLTGLSWTVSGSTTYDLKCKIRATTDVVGGLKLAVNYSGTVTSESFDVIGYSFPSNPKTTNPATFIDSVVGNTSESLEFFGYITTNSSGTLSVQGAQSVASGTTTFPLGSTCTLAVTAN